MLPPQFAVDEVTVPRMLGRGLGYVPGVDLVKCLQHQHLRHFKAGRYMYSNSTTSFYFSQFYSMSSILFYLQPDAEVGGYHVHEAET